MDTPALLQCLATFALNLALAWMVGALTARWWLRRHDGWGAAAGARLLASLRWAAPLCMVAAAAALWAAAAAMAGAPLLESGEALRLLLTQTAFGKAGQAGLAALAVLAALAWLAPSWRGFDGAASALLLAYAASRVANSHAAEQGLFSLGILVEYVHLLLIAQWTGSVAVAAWVVLPRAAAARGQAGLATVAPNRPLCRYLWPLSDTAAAALVGIVATGLYNAWHALGAPSAAIGNPYGTALIVKLVLVGVAIALGGYNKMAGFPAAARGDSPGPAMAVLRIESAVLIGAMLAAAALVGQQPPAAG
ncbi:CopD family protein [Pseudoduganella namucuonensis]|uniref:Putative copper resistance protein D/copper transport protein n=1 Tax=Pseudoduganella namucuonensis TaxID=1035707 RepID=A0A1I7K2G3_9BURK|nr:CopD family protein [Pseudoduganella namucuonensis]SFU91545.1 putative copper resistance protein D/copper transport protein [Pseudoduganella namucuonensis]